MHRLVAAVALLAASSSSSSAGSEIQERVETSRKAVQEFQASLLKELQAAIKEGGPASAIPVCKGIAPRIGTEVSNKFNFKIGRTSLKVRNPKNIPDPWERKILGSFEERKKKGEDVSKLEHFEVMPQNGGKIFRYMKAIAIPANAPCLACHGTNLDPAVRARLKELYPKDQATGFRAGDLRGAFTIQQPY